MKSHPQPAAAATFSETSAKYEEIINSAARVVKVGYETLKNDVAEFEKTVHKPHSKLDFEKHLKAWETIDGDNDDSSAKFSVSLFGFRGCAY